MRFPRLEEFFLRTLVSVTSDGSTEHDVVLAWVHGTGRPQRHPKLFYIALLQQVPHAMPQRQRLSHWFRDGRGRWERVASAMVAATDSFAL